MKTNEEKLIAENARLKKLLKEAKHMLADEILDHRIDIATLEVASEIYNFDLKTLKKRGLYSKVNGKPTFVVVGTGIYRLAKQASDKTGCKHANNRPL